MLDLLRLHVVWDHKSKESERIAETVSRHFDGIGMDRDGVAYRVPVRFSSAPWMPDSSLPRELELDRAQHNAILILYDEAMHEEAGEWGTWLSDLRARMRDRDVYVAFGSPTGEPPPPAEQSARIQYQRRKDWCRMSEEAREQRLLLLLLIAVREHFRKLSGNPRKEPIFVSHAKADGDTTARAIIRFVNDPADGVPLETFYDATELVPGEQFEARFKDEIGHGTLLAIASDIYDSRPWCVFELTEAKRRRRPIVLADVGGKRTSRTYPYGANLPRVHVRPSEGTDWIERILVEAMSEGLRCDLFMRQAAQVTGEETLTLPRPPELFDIVDRDELPARIVYPDPPLGEIEAELVRRALAAAAPGTRLVTLGEIT